MALPWIDTVASTIGDSLTGSYGPEELFTGTPTLASPWSSSWGFPTKGKTPGRQKDRFYGGVPIFGFAGGDDAADQIARARGVNPHATSNIVKLARTQLGSPYVWADSNPAGPVGGPGAGFDCSGFTQWVYKRMGVPLAHFAATQYDQVQHISKEQLQPGDLVFYSYPGGQGGIDHVALYVGNGRQIAASSGEAAVAQQPVDWGNAVGFGHSDKVAGGVIPTKVRGKGAVAHSPQELTVPFPTTFGEAIGGMFNPPQPEIASGGPIGDPSVKLSMKSTTADIQAVAKAEVLRRGWSMADWSALQQLWQHESGWQPNADNPQSTAYGIPQALMSAHPDMPESYRTDPLTQIQWGLDYIASRYGSPSQAWAAWQRRGAAGNPWY